MLTINGKQYRNLTEQVAYLTKCYAQGVIINTDERVSEAELLPPATSVMEGYTVAVGESAPYDYYLSCNGYWVNLGTFPAKGDTGADGQDGYCLFITSEAGIGSGTSDLNGNLFYNPASIDPKPGDVVLGGSDMNIYVITENRAPDFYVEWRGKFKGDQGDTGYSIFTTSESGIDNTTVSLDTTKFYNPESIDPRNGDVVMGGDDFNIYIISAVAGTTATVTWSGALKGYVDDTLTQAGYPADAKAVGDTFDEVFDILYDKKTISYTTTYAAGISSSTLKWTTGADRHCYIQQIPEGAKKIIVTAQSDKNARIAFLTSNAHIGGTNPDYVPGTTLELINAGETRQFDIPSIAIYLYVLKDWTGTTYLPNTLQWMFVKDYQTKIPPLGLHEMPMDDNKLNIIRRCRQLTDIKWTPAVDLKRFMLVQRGGEVIPSSATAENYFGTFKAGKEYTGIPYGRVSQTMTSYGYNYATVGNYIGLDTFVSSISNPLSRLSKTDVSSLANHRSMIYATVCSGLTCYALDVAEVPTASIANISGLSLIGKLNNSGTLLSDEYIQLGDVLNKAGYHTAIITDIIRDSDGTIQLIEISDASTAGLADKNYDEGEVGGLCRRKGWTRQQLFGEDFWGTYSLYRYSGTVTYTPSPYVNIGDEFNAFKIDHFPIMPYEGQGFKYKTGYIPNNAVDLVITLAGYNYVKVFKNGSEISGSPFTVTTDPDTNEIYPISISEIGAGDYTAYLCNITNGDVVNLTYACKWSIE